MLKKAIVLFLLFSLLANAEANEKEAHYENAVNLGECAGLFTMYGQIYEATNKPHQAKDASMKSNGWRIATIGALYKAGWRGERLITTSNSIYEGAVAGWRAQLESGSKLFSDNINKKTNICLSYNETQEDYRKFYKLNGYPK